MFDKMITMYDDIKGYLYRINKNRYITRMTEFNNQYGWIINKMIDYVNSAESPTRAEKVVAENLVRALYEKYSTNGKVKQSVKVDITMFTIYYVAPAILMTDDEHAESLCKTIAEAWAAKFGNAIGFTTYEKLRDSFRNTIFGIPIPGGKK